MTNPGLRGLLFRSAIGSIAVKVGNAAAVFAVSVILARSLGPEAFGLYAFVFALVTLLSVLAKAGLPELLVREVAHCKVDEDWPTLRALLAFGNRGTIVTTTVVMLIAGTVTVIVLGEAGHAEIQTYAWAFALIPVLVLSELRGGAIRGWGQVVTGQLTNILLRPAGLVALLLLAIASGVALTPSRVMALHLLAAVGALVFGLYWSRRLFSDLPDPRQADAKVSGWVREAVPFTMLAGIMVIDSNVDLLMLGLLATDADVGIYRTASQTVVVVAFAISSLNMAVAPHVTRLFRTGDLAGLQQMVRLGSRIIAVLGLPVALALILWGDLFLATVFGDEFMPAAAPLAILCVGQAVNLLMGINGTVLNMTEHARESAWIVAAGALLNVVLNLVLIPRYGINGAAIATASSLALWNILLSITVYRRLKIRTTAFGL